MHQFVYAAAFVAFAGISTLVAAGDAADHGAHHPAATASFPLTDGEVRKVDKEAKKVTIRHGAIQNLDMPAMTMVFQVADAALLDKVKTGDKIRFVAEKQGGAFTVTRIEAGQ